MKRKVLPICISIGLAVSMLAGCGNQSQDAESAAQESVAVSAEDETGLSVETAEEQETEDIDLSNIIKEIPATVMYAISNATLRNGPDTTYDKVGELVYGQKVIVVGEAMGPLGTWYVLKTDDDSVQMVMASLMANKEPSSTSSLGSTKKSSTSSSAKKSTSLSTSETTSVQGKTYENTATVNGSTGGNSQGTGSNSGDNSGNSQSTGGNSGDNSGNSGSNGGNSQNSGDNSGSNGGNSGQTTTIQFSINGTAMQADAGMTWAQWAASTYNTVGYNYDQATNSLTTSDGTKTILLDSAKTDGTITENAAYQNVTITIKTGTDPADTVEYAANTGWTWQQWLDSDCNKDSLGNPIWKTYRIGTGDEAVYYICKVSETDIGVNENTTCVLGYYEKDSVTGLYTLNTVLPDAKQMIRSADDNYYGYSKTIAELKTK